MYIALWRALPDGIFIKLTILISLLIVAVAVLFLGVFPVIDMWLNSDSTVVSSG